MTDSTVAETILAQLGGFGRLIAMTGAKDFLYDANSVQFRIGSGARKRINRIKVTLDPSDTYTIELYAGRGLKIRTVESFSDVYADSLRATVERATGFYLSL